MKYLGNVNHITSGCAFKNAKFLNESSTSDEIITIDGFFYTDINSNFVQTYKDQSIYINSLNENTPLSVSIIFLFLLICL